MTTAQERGFRIKGEFYPLITDFRLVDPLLVEQITGVPWSEYVARQDAWMKSEGSDFDPVVHIGAISVAVWQRHPEWSPAEAIRFIQGTSFLDIEQVGDEEPQDDEERPTKPARSRKPSLAG